MAEESDNFDVFHAIFTLAFVRSMRNLCSLRNHNPEKLEFSIPFIYIWVLPLIAVNRMTDVEGCQRQKEEDVTLAHMCFLSFK
jgi:hypothetical protein